MSTKKLTPAELAAYRELARAARRLRAAQHRAQQQQQAKPTKRKAVRQ